MKKFAFLMGISLLLVGCGKKMPENIPVRPDGEIHSVQYDSQSSDYARGLFAKDFRYKPAA